MKLKNNKNKTNKSCIYEDNKIDFSKCEYNTLIANNNVKLENLHKENMSKNGKSRIIQLWDNSCFDINELVYFVIGNSGENRNPFNNNKIWQDIDEI
jgi:hypothetical protein